MFKNKNYVSKLLLAVFTLLMVNTISAQTIIKGVVKDSKTNESIPGVTISIKGTTIGAISDIDGNYQLNVSPGKHTVVTSYISYQSIEITDVVVEKNKPVILDIPMTEAAQNLSDVIVVARKNMESEMNLMMERQRATVAVENLGAREMSSKGLSTVADGTLIKNYTKRVPLRCSF